MNKNFGEWYIENKIILSEEKQLEKRWQGVESFCNEATTADMTNLALLFFGFDVGDKFIEKICNIFKDYDDFFSKKAILEIRVLSGAILLHMAQTIKNYSSYIELLVKSASFAQGRAINFSILNEIESELKQDSDNIRKNLITEAKLVTVPKTKSILELLKNGTLDDSTYTALVS